MSDSPLVDIVRLSPNSMGRATKIDTITPHTMNVDQSVEACGAYFQMRSAKASSNYGIDTQGRVGLYVPEARRSMASNNWRNDDRAITIEVATDGPGPEYHVSDQALAKFVDLCVDICQRNGIDALRYTGDTSGNVTLHKWFVCKPCPSPYFEARLPELIEEINRRLRAAKARPKPPRGLIEHDEQAKAMPPGIFRVLHE
jgi:hypothetical protein